MNPPLTWRTLPKALAERLLNILLVPVAILLMSGLICGPIMALYAVVLWGPEVFSFLGPWGRVLFVFGCVALVALVWIKSGAAPLEEQSGRVQLVRR